MTGQASFSAAVRRARVAMGEVEEEIVVRKIATDVQDYRPLWSSFGFKGVGIHFSSPHLPRSGARRRDGLDGCCRRSPNRRVDRAPLLMLVPLVV